MGDEVKSNGRTQQISLTLKTAVPAACAALRDRFREILGSEPIVEVEPNSSMFNINTYGGGEYANVGRFGLEQLHGCCGVVVFFHASVSPKFRGKHIGRLLLELRQNAAILAGYSLAQATVLRTNKPEIALLEGAGWKASTEFLNRRTKNDVRVYLREL